MMNNAKILWGEGLFLRPQHFQYQDAYIDAQFKRTLLAANPSPGGCAILISMSNR